MSLWTDAYPITQADLLVFDADSTRVATDEEITLSDIIAISYAECGRELLNKLDVPMGGVVSDVSAAHLAAVMNTGVRVSPSRYGRLGQVVSTHPSVRYTDVRAWLAYVTLAKLYRVAASRKVNDRYAGKIAVNEDEAQRSWSLMIRNGIPVVDYPLPCPGAEFERNQGTWSSANLSSVVSSGTTGGTYSVKITWTNSEATDGNGESGPSAAASVTVAAGSVLRVSISGLTPPSGTALAEIAGDSAETAVADGWNVYVGGIRQNSTPIALTSTTYTLAADPATSGTAIGDGQRPTVQIKPVPFVMHG